MRYRDYVIFKMATVHHLGFSIFLIFEQHPGFGGLMCISVQNLVEIGGTVAEIL